MLFPISKAPTSGARLRGTVQRICPTVGRARIENKNRQKKQKHDDQGMARVSSSGPCAGDSRTVFSVRPRGASFFPPSTGSAFEVVNLTRSLRSRWERERDMRSGMVWSIKGHGAPDHREGAAAASALGALAPDDLSLSGGGEGDGSNRPAVATLMNSARRPGTRYRGRLLMSLHLFESESTQNSMQRAGMSMSLLNTCTAPFSATHCCVWCLHSFVFVSKMMLTCVLTRTTPRAGSASGSSSNNNSNGGGGSGGGMDGHTMGAPDTVRAAAPGRLRSFVRMAVVTRCFFVLGGFVQAYFELKHSNELLPSLAYARGRAFPHNRLSLLPHRLSFLSLSLSLFLGRVIPGVDRYRPAEAPFRLCVKPVQSAMLHSAQYADTIKQEVRSHARA